jgi:hypothetical protein
MNSLLPLLLFSLQGALSFFTSDILPFVSRASFTRRMRLSPSLRMALSDLGDLVSSLPLEPKSTELWLDLRGTAVHPRAAVDYILKELEEEGLLFPSTKERPLIAKVVISDFSFQQLLNASDPFVEAFEILYPPEGAGDGFLASSRSGLSLPFGHIITTPDGNSAAVGDLMDAMRLLGDGGGIWIFLDNGNRELDPEKESLQMDAISSFLDIASTASAGPWGKSVMKNGNDSELVLPSGKIGDMEESGGVAVRCPTKSFLLQLASVLQCFQSVSTTTMTESGIIIQGGEDVYVPSLPTAVVLPFDLLLWKTAMLVYGQ